MLTNCIIDTDRNSDPGEKVTGDDHEDDRYSGKRQRKSHY